MLEVRDEFINLKIQAIFQWQQKSLRHANSFFNENLGSSDTKKRNRRKKRKSRRKIMRVLMLGKLNFDDLIFTYFEGTFIIVALLASICGPRGRKSHFIVKTMRRREVEWSARKWKWPAKFFHSLQSTKANSFAAHTLLYIKLGG